MVIKTTVIRRNNQRSHEQSTVYWKDAILALLEMGHMWLEVPDGQKSIISKGLVGIRYSLHSPADFLIHMDDELYIDVLSKASDSVAQNISEKIINRLIDMKLVHQTNLDDINVPIYLLTTKGIDSALMLQAHKDDERRFNQQEETHKVMKDNSTHALFLSTVAISCAGSLALFSFLNLIINCVKLGIPT